MLQWVAQVKSVVAVDASNVVSGIQCERLVVVSPDDGETIIANHIHGVIDPHEGDWIMQVDDVRMPAVTAEALAAIDAARAAARAADKRPSAGRVVMWTSQAGGRTKTKTGTIMKVVPPNTHPRDALVGTAFSVDAGSLGRDHESYLVQVGHSKHLYWPLVSKLTVIG